MTGDMLYTSEKFSAAVYVLATSSAPLRDRVVAAQNEFRVVDDVDLPEEARADFRALIARLTALGTVAETIATVSDVEVRRLAHLIYDVHVRIDSALSRRGRDA